MIQIPLDYTISEDSNICHTVILYVATLARNQVLNFVLSQMLCQKMTSFSANRNSSTRWTVLDRDLRWFHDKSNLRNVWKNEIKICIEKVLRSPRLGLFASWRKDLTENKHHSIEIKWKLIKRTHLAVSFEWSHRTNNRETQIHMKLCGQLLLKIPTKNNIV